MGIHQPCFAFKSRLALLSNNLDDSKESHDAPDVELNDLVPVDKDTDVAAVTTFDSCGALSISKAALGFMRPNSQIAIEPVEDVGFSTESRKLLKRGQGGWTIAGMARREVQPWRKRGSDGDYSLQNSQRSRASGRQNGGLILEFGPDGRFESAQMFFTGADLYLIDSISLPNGSILLLGSSNFAQFAGSLSN
jgi:hypothetical protein